MSEKSALDWDSPSTKKHIAEAAARGCELLAIGRNANYRVFRLPCGHEQEIQISVMRRGEFSCQACFNSRLESEAEVQGCRLLGKARDASNRTYLLPCGHKQVIGTSSMRKGTFKCQTCIEIRHRKEADAQNCELLRPGKNISYRIYRLPCGHEQDIQLTNMRRGRFRCQTCVQVRLRAEAEVNGCKLLGPGKSKAYRLYQLPCGHEQDLQPSTVRSGQFGCQGCLEKRLVLEAEVQGCKVVGPGRKFGERRYRLECGHEQIIGLKEMRIGQFRCQKCLAEKLEAEATAQGCVLVGPARTSDYRTYRLACGHEQEIAVTSVRVGYFGCQTCGNYAFTQPSQLYLLHIKVEADEWLKLGYAKNIETRSGEYGLPSSALKSVLSTREFETGLEAMRFEQSLHKKYKRKRLSVNEMRQFHVGSGATECYPVTMVETLLAEFTGLDDSEG